MYVYMHESTIQVYIEYIIDYRVSIVYMKLRDIELLYTI